MRKNLYLYWQNLHNMTLFITIDKMKFHEWYEPEVMRNYSVSVELSPASSCVWWWLWVVIVLSTTFSLSVSTGVSGCFVQKKYFISLHGLILILLHRLASVTHHGQLQTFRISFELPAVKKLQKFESSPSIESPVMPLVSPWPIKMRLFFGKNNAKSA